MVRSAVPCADTGKSGVTGRGQEPGPRVPSILAKDTDPFDTYLDKTSKWCMSTLCGFLSVLSPPPPAPRPPPKVNVGVTYS